MKSKLRLSPLAEVRLPDEVLAHFGALFIRICLIIYALPVSISLYRNLFLEPSNLALPIVTVYALTALLTWRQNLLSAPQQISFMILLLALGAVAVTIRNESFMSASTSVLFASIALMMLVGLRWALAISLLFLSMLFALFLSFDSADRVYGTIHMALSIGIQIGVLIAINSLLNLFSASRARLEQTLRLTEIASSQSRVGLFRHDLRSDHWMVNQVYRQMFGVTHDEPIYSQDHLITAAHPEDLETLIEQLNEAIPIGESRSCLHRFTGDLGTRWVRITLNMIEEDGHPVAYGSVVDIHEHKMRQIDLDQAHLENSELLEHLRLTTEEADIRIIEENLTQNTARFLARGKSPRPEPPTYADRLEILDPNYLGALQHAYSAPGNVAEYPIFGKRYVAGVEWLRQRYVRRIERDGDEIAVFMVTSITQEKKAQFQLQRSLQQVEEALTRQDEIAEAGKIGLFEWSVDSDLIRSNIIFRQQTGLDEAAWPIIRVDNLIELFDEEQGRAFIDQMRNCSSADGAYDFQVGLRLVSGERRWFRLTASAHTPESGGKRIYASVVDITEHLALEQQLRELNAKLHLQSRTDSLTKLANRREMDEYLDTQLTLRQREPDSSFSLIMADIDFFKRYNDHYGHPAGDLVLQQVGQIMHGAARRPSDLVARYGGEEFILILPDTDVDGAKLVCAKIREALANAQLAHEESPHQEVTLSLGISTLKPLELASGTRLIEAADQALYAAKEQGRNRTEFRPVIG